MGSDLTDSDFSTLNHYLGQVVDGRIPNTEALDGFFAALICSPDMVMANEYIAFIKGEIIEDVEIIFQGTDESKQFAGLLIRFWGQVHQRLHSRELYTPLLLEDPAGKYPGNDWANGFLNGTKVRLDIWSCVIIDDELADLFVPITALAYENHPDPELRPFENPIEDEQRLALLAGVSTGVVKLFAHFWPQIESYFPHHETFIRSGPKIGRNAPCPCGSGKKYKKCCGSNVH